MSQEGGYSGRLRKRKRGASSPEDNLGHFLDAAQGCSRIMVFSGSGLSATSGMSMFSTRNGLYDRARKKFKIQDGIKLFSFPFFKQRKADVQAFFAQIYSEAKASVAAPGHHALAAIHGLGRLQRHYTMNIDGLAEVVGMDTWHWDSKPEGITVEMHGNVRQLVCPECHAVQELSRVAINTLKCKKSIPCSACKKQDLRFKVMLYDDEEGDAITPEHVWDVLEQDLQVVDMIVWVGISFEQSASTEYFRKVRGMLQSNGRLQQLRQVVINPSDEAIFNLLSACSNTKDLQVMDVRATADEAMPALANRLVRPDANGASYDDDPVAIASGALTPSDREPTPGSLGGSSAPASGAPGKRGRKSKSPAAQRGDREPTPGSVGGSSTPVSGGVSKRGHKSKSPASRRGVKARSQSRDLTPDSTANGRVKISTPVRHEAGATGSGRHSDVAVSGGGSNAN